MIRVMVNENNEAVPAYVDTIRATIEELAEQKCDEVIIPSKRITDARYCSVDRKLECNNTQQQAKL